jgi:hypothetical protein
MNTKTFVLVSPHIDPASNGIMLFYQMGSLLRELGHTAYYTPLDRQSFLLHLHHYPEEVLVHFIRDYADIPSESIAIFPDSTPPHIIAQIPSSCRAWYLANKPWILTGQPVDYQAEDAVIVYSNCVSKIYHCAFLNRRFNDFDPLAPEHQSNCREKTDLILIYFGKSKTNTLSKPILNLIRSSKCKVLSINRQFPNSREQLYSLLRRAKLLISFDPFTNLNYEATLCATPCYIADNYMNVNYDDYNLPLHGVFVNDDLLEHYFNTGIEPEMQEEIWQAYRESTSNHLDTMKGFVAYLDGWFSIVNQAKADSNLKQLLEMHNALRIESDLLYYKSVGAKPIIPALMICRLLDNFGDWLYDAIERNKTFLFRIYHQHILRLKRDELVAILQEYKHRRLERQEVRTNKILERITK